MHEYYKTFEKSKAKAIEVALKTLLFVNGHVIDCVEADGSDVIS